MSMRSPGRTPYSGTMTFSKLLDDCPDFSLTLELEDLPFLELDDFPFLELEVSAFWELLDSAELSSLTLEELLSFLLELDDFAFLELEDFSSLELDDFAFLELLETSFAEELVSMTAVSFSFSLLAAVAESPSQLAQKAAVNDSRTFFQCLCKSMLIIRPFFRAKYTKLVRFDYSTSLFGLGEFPLEVPAAIFFAGTGRFCLFGTAAGFARGTRFFFVIIVFFLVIFSVFIF